MYPKKKKIPIKGEPKAKEQKPCSECGKPKVLANKTKRLCATCLAKSNKEKQKVRKEKKRKEKQDTITQSRLDQVTSWLVRAAHEHKCHSCEIPLDPKISQCCHFVGRTKGPTRYDLFNLLPGCKICNLFTPHHVWALGKTINKLWGEDTTEHMLTLAGHQLKLSNYDRSLVYKVYKQALDKIQGGNFSQDEKYEILMETREKYKQIIWPLIK